MEQLDDISAPVQPYPYNFIFPMNRDRINLAANNFYVASTTSDWTTEVELVC